MKRAQNLFFSIKQIENEFNEFHEQCTGAR